MRKQIDIVQVFRGLAALAVVIHHIVPSLSYFQNTHFPLLDFLASLGKYGVDFFFILSGFIIHYSNAHKINNSISNFIKNRVLRIYIPYLPIGIAMYLLYLFLPSLSESPRDVSALTSFTLFPDGDPALAVAWTLSFEMFFYLLYSICIFNRSIWNVLLIFWAVTIVCIQFSGIQFQTTFWKMIFSFYNLHFMLGYLLATAIIAYKSINKKVVILSGISFFIAFVLCKYFDLVPFSFFINLLFAAFSFFLIYYFVFFESLSFKKGNVFMLIGNSSYSLYLVHGPLHAFIERFLPQSSSVQIFVLYILIVLVICIIAGFSYYYIFEKKIMTLFRRK